MSERVRPAWQLRLAAAAYRFRESLFLLPTLIVAGGIVLAWLTTVVDEAVGTSAVPFTLSMSSNAATWLLATVAGAMITTAGVVFSLTVVSLQLASSQFSPRVMRSFIRDRLSQSVIGLLVATFVYCVLTLPAVSGEATDPAPQVALTVALALTVATVVTIIAHLDHLARRLQVGHVVRDIAAEGEAVIAALARREHRTSTHDAVPTAPPEGALTVPCPTSGWVSQVAADRIFAASPAGTTVRLETRVGAYIHAGEPLLSVWPAPADAAVVDRLGATVLISAGRTMQQDVDFALRQLVDVALRALSAAVNDPSTAIEVILRIGSLLRRLLVTDLPGVSETRPGRRTLVRPWDLDHAEYVAHAFDQLRQEAPAQPQVAAALLRVLRMLVAHAQDAGRREHVPALQEQLDLLLDALRSYPGLHGHDLARLLAIADDATDPAEHTRG